MNKPLNISLSVINFIILIWLMFLTVLSVFIDDFIADKTLFVITVLMIVFLKGQAIIDIYMEMSTAPRKWRMLLLSYVVILPLILSAIYLWSL